LACRGCRYFYGRLSVFLILFLLLAGSHHRGFMARKIYILGMVIGLCLSCYLFWYYYQIGLVAVGFGNSLTNTPHNQKDLFQAVFIALWMLSVQSFIDMSFVLTSLGWYVGLFLIIFSSYKLWKTNKNPINTALARFLILATMNKN
jgi:hypothetical protein